MITLKRKQLEEFLKDLLSSIKIVKRPILILGDNDNERIEIFKGLKDKCSSSVDIWSPRRTDALMYECHKYGDISIDEEYVNWSVNIFKKTGKPVVYNVFFNDVSKLNNEVLCIFDIIIYECTKTDWLEWAKELNPNTGNPNVNPLIVDFLENSDDKYFIGTTPEIAGLNAKTGKLGWIVVNNTWSPTEEYLPKYIANNIETTFNEEFAQAFCDYHNLGCIKEIVEELQEL